MAKPLELRIKELEESQHKLVEAADLCTESGDIYNEHHGKKSGVHGNPHKFLIDQIMAQASNISFEINVLRKSSDNNGSPYDNNGDLKSNA